ncbi:MAG: 6-carboxy-5,6,7,8-tetrahydropterin synthase [Syntrophorhabdaceae bacterium PtaU1.Bin034]|nr:MAG: 6-carboxy-5,6,7,8-tetrahydropterin synthase [Syntrophorhabdaceae bacterium PtaU1.Bin034]
MFTLFVRETFAAAHKLDLYEGKCEELHGHNFRVEALFKGDKVGREGMLLDFTVLKAYLREIVSDLDHKYLNDIPFFKERASSSEYLALYIHDRLKDMVKKDGVTVSEVRVWESDNAYAAYGEPR